MSWQTRACQRGASRRGARWCFTQNKQIHPHSLKRHKANCGQMLHHSCSCFHSRKHHSGHLRGTASHGEKSLCVVVGWLPAGGAQRWMAALKGEQGRWQPHQWALEPIPGNPRGAAGVLFHQASSLAAAPLTPAFWAAACLQMKYSSSR